MYPFLKAPLLGFVNAESIRLNLLFVNGSSFNAHDLLSLLVKLEKTHPASKQGNSVRDILIYFILGAASYGFLFWLFRKLEVSRRSLNKVWFGCSGMCAIGLALWPGLVFFSLISLLSGVLEKRYGGRSAGKEEAVEYSRSSMSELVEEQKRALKEVQELRRK